MTEVCITPTYPARPSPRRAHVPLPRPPQIFMSVHDPTTPNRQGNDVGPQYRSIVLYGNEEQKRVAEEVRVSLAAGAPCTCTCCQRSGEVLFPPAWHPRLSPNNYR